MLEGRTALITGATGGLGLEMARRFHEAGAAVLLTGLGDEAEIAALDAALRRDGPGGEGAPVEIHPADAARPEQLAALVAAFAGRGIAVDILVNNAGVQHVSPIESFPAAAWDRLIAVNLSAPFHLIRALVGGMKERGWGRIVNIASVHGLVGSPDKSAYVASKHGLVGLTKAVALETAGTGVTCNVLCPGLLMTPLSASQIAETGRRLNLSFEEATRRLLRDKQPSMQTIPLCEIAELALHLCSGAASQMTGAAIPVDGAWTAQ